MASPLSKYALINAKLRARISKILPAATLDQMVKAPSLDAALAVLRDTPFAGLEDIYSRTGDLKEAELSLLKTEICLYGDVRKHLHPNSAQLIDALLTQFEIDNLKNAIRVYFDRKIRQRTADTSVHYILHDRIIHARRRRRSQGRHHAERRRPGGTILGDGALEQLGPHPQPLVRLDPPHPATADPRDDGGLPAQVHDRVSSVAWGARA